MERGSYCRETPAVQGGDENTEGKRLRFPGTPEAILDALVGSPISEKSPQAEEAEPRPKPQQDIWRLVTSCPVWA